MQTRKLTSKQPRNLSRTARRRQATPRVPHGQNDLKLVAPPDRGPSAILKEGDTPIIKGTGK